jgi:hypothetical protein
MENLPTYPEEFLPIEKWPLRASGTKAANLISAFILNHRLRMRSLPVEREQLFWNRIRGYHKVGDVAYGKASSLYRMARTG